MNRSNLVLRSMMFVPGHNERLMISASKSTADALIFDLEDSVQPASNKKVARKLIREMIESGIFKGFSIFPRINDRDSGFLLKDISALTIEGVTGFVYPKAVNGNDIYFFDKLLDAIEAEKNIPIGTYKIVPLIETASAALNALDICQVSERVVGIAFGCEDFIADLEGIHTKEGESIYVPRTLVAMAARATGVIPIDTVHIDVHDLEDFEKNVILAKKLGFEGNLILHPKELPIAHKYYTPSESEVAGAQEIIRLFETMEKEGKGVAVFDGKFIGPPIVAGAKKVLTREELIKRGTKSK